MISGGLSWLISHLIEKRDRERVSMAVQKFEEEDKAIEMNQKKTSNILSRGSDSDEELNNSDEGKEENLENEEEGCKTTPHNFWVDTLHFSPNLDMNRILLACLWIIINITIGSIFYATIVDNMSVIDSIYFSTMTITTVGYGDITPGEY